MKTKVNPKILIWAREERFGNMTTKDVADKIGIDFSDLIKWELDGEGIPFDVLELIAKIYKRQTATFFLPNVPPKAKKIKDYRNFTVGNVKFSPDILLAIRRTERYLEIARELEDPIYWGQQYQWVNNFNGKKENIKKETANLRELFGSPKDGRINHGKPDAVFRYWRSKVEEKLGIFVFQFPMSEKIPEDEIDGFSYAFDAFPYAIVVNNQKAPVRKIFTMFHEVAHILKHASGVCKPDFSSTQEKFALELECNSFAGEFLVPSQSVRVVDSVDKIFNFAKLFNVSGESYLRRLFELKKIDRDTFFDWLGEVRERSNRFIRKPKKGGGPSRFIQSKSTRGNKFFNLVANAAIANRISFSTASDLLELKASSIHL
jgi:Zn-dependent peptidase ImmA (M78 family)